MTPKEQEQLIIERDALKKQLADERAITERQAIEWQESVDSYKSQLAEREAALKAACPPVEAPFSINWQMIGKYDEVLQCTARAGITPEIAITVMKVRNEFLEMAVKGGYKFPEKPKPAPAAKENKAVAIVKAAGAAPEVVKQVAAATNHVKPILEIHAVHMTVEPKPGDKVSINFFGNDKRQPHNQYADIYTTRTAEQLVKDMPFLDPEVFESAEEYAVDLLIGYTLSDKLNTKGNPYKDIQYIKQAN